MFQIRERRIHTLAARLHISRFTATRCFLFLAVGFFGAAADCQEDYFMGSVVYVVEYTVISHADAVLGEEQGNAKGRAEGFYFLTLWTRIAAQRIYSLFYP